jgi:hypothetical protein
LEKKLSSKKLIFFYFDQQERRGSYLIGNGEEPEIPISATCREKCTFELVRPQFKFAVTTVEDV